MKQIQIAEGRPAAQILVGKLKDPFTVQAGQTTKELSGWDMRAMWSFMRLGYGRSIDKKIHDYMEEVKQARKVEKLSFPQRQEAMAEYFNETLTKHPVDRKIQFIMLGSSVRAVASLGHLLIPAATVYDAAQRTVTEKFDKKAQLETEQRMFGKVWFLEEELGLHYGLQFHAGDITTRLAIKVCGFVRVLQCTNPVSWLGIGGFGGWINKPEFERVLRIKGVTELDAKLEIAIENAKQELVKVKKTTLETQHIPLDFKTFKPISAAMTLSYGLGLKIIEQLWQQFKEEPQTLYGAAMAASWLAKHGNFRKMTAQKLDSRGQKLSTIGGAMLLIKNPKEAETKSLAWLKAHVTEGQPQKLAADKVVN